MPPQPPATKKEEPPEEPRATEEEATWAWRFQELRRLGIPHEDAELLADIADSHHMVDDLLKAGCPHETAARIVL